MKKSNVVFLACLAMALASVVSAGPYVGFEVRGIQLDPSNPGGFDNDINNTAEAKSLFDNVTGTGDYNIGGQNYRVTTYAADVRPYINLGGDNGHINFPPNTKLGYPGGIGGDDFLVAALADLVIPVGTWTIAFGSDDGGFITLPGVTFTSKFNSNYGGSDTVGYKGTRAHAQTGGVFTVSGSPLATTMTSLFFERGSGDSFEISIAPGAHSSFWGGSALASFQLLGDGQYGWSVTNNLAAAPGFTPITPITPPPAFNARLIRIQGGGGSNDSQINSAAEALSIAQNATGTGLLTIGSTNYNVTVFSDEVTPIVDYAGGGGSFGYNRKYPDGHDGGWMEDFLVRAHAWVRIPPGTWTIGFGSDDGGLLRLDGLFGATITFTNEYNTNGDSGLDNEVRYNGVRGHSWTRGVFTVSDETYAELTALFFERGGGDSFEIALAQGARSGFNTNDFQLLYSGLHGWIVSPTLIPEPSTALLALLGLAGLRLRRRQRAR